MPQITLHRYRSPARTIRLEFDDIASMTRQSDHALPPGHFTLVRLKPGCRTVDGKTTAVVSENESQIKQLAARSRAGRYRI